VLGAWLKWQHLHSTEETLESPQPLPTCRVGDSCLFLPGTCTLCSYMNKRAQPSSHAQPKLGTFDFDFIDAAWKFREER
jgi:hypothetical protein